MCISNLENAMRSKKNGEHTLAVEVLNISPHGFWLLIQEREYFLAFEHFPWFRQASIEAILNVQLPQPHHLYWPQLDVDLELDAIISPQNYPLVDRHGLSTVTGGSKKPEVRKAKKSRAQRAQKVLAR